MSTSRYIREREVIKADTVDVAVDRILVELGKDTTSSRENYASTKPNKNAIYFDGWDGLGASAVLQSVAKLLGLQFEKIIHIDCSKWESRRAMQREIAEQLNLPNWVMNMFEKQDEEDDFNGNEEIDIFKFGLYIYGYANSKMLWTFQGRFRLDPKMIDNVKKSTSTDVVLSASSDRRDPQELWSYLVHHEAAQVSCHKNGHSIIEPAICVLYIMKQCHIGSHIVDYEWAIHTSNYWVCDGIIALTDTDKAWQVGDVLQHEVRLLDVDGDSTTTSSSHLARSTKHMPYWISTAICGFVLSPSGAIADVMFQRSHRLSVLKLSRCTFNFSSPAFLCCHSLRFLWLENCADLLTRTYTIDHHQRDPGKEGELDNSTMTSWECFQSLWVLDLRYTDWDQILSARVMDLMTQVRELNVMGAKHWDMSHLRGRLPNIRKLRVTKSTCCFNNDVLSEMKSIEILDFSGNTIKQGMASLTGPPNNSSLKTVTIGGCDGLKVVTFRGCKESENLFLKGTLESLEELDLSGTRVKNLNLTGVEARSLPKQIILQGCEKLRAILWPMSVTEEGLPKVLHIDTTSPSATAYGGEAPLVHPHADTSLHQQIEEMFKGGWQISLTDTRLLRSLSPLGDFPVASSIHIDICPAATDGGTGSNIQGTSSETPAHVQPHTSTVMDSNYRDTLKDGPVAAVMMWDCPKICLASWRPMTCIIRVIVHGQDSKLLEDAPDATTSTLLLPDFICEQVTSLHVTSLSPRGAPSCTVFTVPQGPFYLETFWASQLLSAVYIWNKPVKSNFEYFNFLHLDHCPRLVHVLPMSVWKRGTTFSSLETIEIVYCSDLREILPTLHCICGRRMSAPQLETIKIRGCWSLRRLPVVGRHTKPPKVDCEKEWWDSLEWDRVETHQPSRYEPRHSMYYKAQLPGGTVLRIFHNIFSFLLLHSEKENNKGGGDSNLSREHAFATTPLQRLLPCIQHELARSARVAAVLLLCACLVWYSQRWTDCNLYA
ncbi:hypothetical protein VPH35_102382 [Triticum aestivum]